ncbi:MAG TPA: response regulator transcription factor [candidate division Zixibacteria bacterium]|nr:response regulator transcription factor [candidate division Zixibacteria bacterium]
MLKIILADNQAIFRAGIAKVLAVEDDVRIVAQAQTVEQMMVAAEKFRGAVLVFASSFLPDLDKLAEVASTSGSRLVVIAENGEQPDRYIRVGVRGVVFRSVGGEELLKCVRMVCNGEIYVHDSHMPTRHSDSDDFVGARVRDRLTPKELKIVALIVQGFKNKEIAVQLGTTEQVVKNYLRNVYDKIGVSDRLELALFTIHHRILAEAAAATAAAMQPRENGDATKPVTQ